MSEAFMQGRRFRAARGWAALFFLTFFITPLLSVSGASDGGVRAVAVAAVIDGDTFVLPGGERVRLLGIDTPEAGEPFYIEAKRRSAELLASGPVSIRVCAGEPRDGYGRTLAWATAGAGDVNASLLKEGLARALIIPPCGLERADEFRGIEREAKAARRGLWGAPPEAYNKPPRYARVAAKDARASAGKMASVHGTVSRVHRTSKAVFLDFKGTDFTAVIFKRGIDGLEAAGLRPEDYIARRVTVSGEVRIYKGRPEIVVTGAAQIAPDSE